MWGYIDKQGADNISFEYEHAAEFQEGFGRVRVGGKFGFILQNGTIAIPPKYGPETKGFTEGRAVVEDTIGRQGYIENSGDFVIEPQFSMAYAFSDGLACVGLSCGEVEYFGFVDLDGTLVIPAQFESPGQFSEGLAPILIDGKHRYVDRCGDIASDKFVSAGLFNCGIAAVESSDGCGLLDHGMNFRSVNVDCLYAGFENRFIGVRFDCHGTRKYGIFDSLGEEVVSVVLEDARFFSQGLAAAKMNGKWGYLDRNGNWAIEPVFDCADRFSDSMAKVTNGERKGYIDKNGSWLLEHLNCESFDFKDGLAAAYHY